jgi:putative hemolysin
MSIDQLMTPRDRILWLDHAAGPESWQTQLNGAEFTRYPVADGELDRYVGYVKVQDLLSLALAHDPPDLDTVLRKPHVLPGWTPVFRLLELFQWSHVHMALVTDGDGRIRGIVTLYDVLEGIVGNLPETREAVVPGMVEREDGSWLVDGLLPFQEFLETFHGQDMGLPEDPEMDPQQYPTLHAFLLDRMDAEPRPAAVLRWRDLRLEVMDMDGSRIDKVMVRSER